MKKIVLFFTILIIPVMAFGQWTSSSGDNKFDGKYRSAMVIGKGSEWPYNRPTLVINLFESSTPNIYLTNIGYTGCGSAAIEITFDNTDKIYTYNSYSNSDNDAAFIDYNNEVSHYNSLNLSDLLDLFKEKTRLYIRYSSSCGCRYPKN
ncbi:hypothetical protein [Robiginitalea aurantiaca]|uniref:Uncharacterized protein n=1 Tax=Robiginitalea aurantiaca TaxID=3056915 RepID=A0ABT7WGS8_9FLAO|nr:hypothetical protein [Robiginitalea aurantiaca]MDM9632122.1 hypothetical protein [Robiginitalea aurantiaca]